MNVSEVIGIQLRDRLGGRIGMDYCNGSFQLLPNIDEKKVH